LIYSGDGSGSISHAEHVKLVGQVNYATILPMCREPSITVARAPSPPACAPHYPTLVLWDVADQPIWGAQVKNLKVGSARRLTRITPKIAGQRASLDPFARMCCRAREIAPRMTRPVVGVTTAADLLEQTARAGRPSGR